MGYLAGFELYLRRHPRRYARTTIRKRCAVVARYLEEVDDWRSVTVRDVEDWAGSLDLATSTVRDHVSHVRAFYRWAVREELVEVNPCDGVDLGRSPRRVPRPASDRDIARAMVGARPHVRAMIALMAGGGLRCVEVSRMRWADVDIYARTVRVRGKGDRVRVVEVGPDVIRALLAVDGGVPASPVFAGRHGLRYTPARVSAIVAERFREVDSSVTAHQLRHRFATAALGVSGDIVTVRDLLGHSSVAVTEGYAAAAAPRARDASSRVDVPGS